MVKYNIQLQKENLCTNTLIVLVQNNLTGRYFSIYVFINLNNWGF